MSRDFLTFGDLNGDEAVAILARAAELAAAWSERRMPATLAGKRLALVVNDGGWRNTTAFHLGVSAMGGICVPAPLRLDGAETVPDLAAYLDNWVDATIVRTPDLSILRSLADAAAAPVINARTRQNHPCETLGDLAYYWSRHHRVENVKVAVIAPRSNILGSWIDAAETLQLEVVQIFPEEWHDPRSTVGGFRTSEDMNEAKDADIVVTDCWPDEGDADLLDAYRVTRSFLDGSRPDLEFLPCPPVTRGQEISADAMTHPRCTVVQAKAFLLHGQNALLEWVLATKHPNPSEQSSPLPVRRSNVDE